MDRALEELIWTRARSRCEYCLLPARYTEAPFQIDHIIARKHGGETVEGNLALSCYSCNTYKGPNIASLDPDSGRLVRLFHPRKDRWVDHFAWDGPMLVGRTAIARATMVVLWMNHPVVVETRRLLIAEGVFRRTRRTWRTACPATTNNWASSPRPDLATLGPALSGFRPGYVWIPDDSRTCNDSAVADKLTQVDYHSRMMGAVVVEPAP